MGEGYRESNPDRGDPFASDIEYRPEKDPTGKVELEPEGPRVVAIFTCSYKGLPMVQHTSVEAVAGRGLVGDRYYLETGAYSGTKPAIDRDVSIISFEDIIEANVANGTDFSLADTRRNIVVTGIKLNDLVDRSIKLGNVSIRVTGPCEPCDRPSHLSGKDGFGTVFDKRGGIRGRILNNGEIRVGSSLKLFRKNK